MAPIGAITAELKPMRDLTNPYGSGQRPLTRTIHYDRSVENNSLCRLLPSVYRPAGSQWVWPGRAVRGRADELAEAFTEIESSKNADRPQLARALDACRLTAGVLVVAKLDRLSRDAHFLLGLEKAGVEFVAADMPNANRLTVRLMAVIAQEEREMISARTKAALAAAKARVRSWAASVAARRLIQPRAEPRAVVRPTITPARLGR